MQLSHFFAQHQIFTLDSLRNWIGGTVNQSTFDSLIEYHVKKGHILRLRRGLYYCVAQGFESENCPVDPFLITAKLTPDAVLAYHTALNYYGKLHSVRNDFLFLTANKDFKVFEFRGMIFKGVQIPIGIVSSPNSLFGVEQVNRLGVEIMVTSLERTVVDILDRPKLTGSWEEIWLSLETIEYLDLDMVFDYATVLNKASTFAKLGFFLEDHHERFSVSEKFLDRLETFKPTSKIYMDRHYSGPHKFLKKWNMYVPLQIINKEWEEDDEIL